MMEPERPIEKLLRTWARKRREAAPDAAEFELRPATRRRLHEEAARRWAGPEREPGWWFALGRRHWPRLAWGLGVTAALAVVIAFVVSGLRRPQPHLSLAQNKSSLKRRAAPPAPPAASPAQPPAETAKADLRLGASAGTAGSPVSSNGSLLERRYGLAGAVGGTNVAVATREPLVQRFARAQSKVKGEMDFVDKLPSAESVLTSFRVEQSGQRLRVIDRDGSVYTGSLQVAAKTARRRSGEVGEVLAAGAAERAAEGELPPATAAAEPAWPSYSFRVAGTNRTLSQPVVFTGTLLAATNRALQAQGFQRLDSLGERGTSASAPASARPSGGLLLNTRISGTAQVGSGKPIQILATPAEP